MGIPLTVADNEGQQLGNRVVVAALKPKGWGDDVLRAAETEPPPQTGVKVDGFAPKTLEEEAPGK